MIPDFLLRAGLGGLAFALMCAPVGCFVVWRRLAYFGTAVSHAALLGVAVGLLAGIDLMIGVFAVAVATALLLARLDRITRLPGDTLLGLMAHGSLAAGLVVLAFLPRVRVDLMSYLFGDVLALGWDDVALAGGAAVLVGLAMAALWRPLLSMAVDPDIAAVEGVPVHRLDPAFLVLLALVVAVGLQIVGVLLVVSLLIIPPATARAFARTPEAMAIGAALAGTLSVVGGLALSASANLPAGPAIVLVSSGLFALSLLAAGLTRR
ncbi:MAG: metal ABC transporter permease [Alphaproteobacteria bacterium]|nr:metal ABC transporter permease [Alphaproteobacteria bacterium]